QRVVCRVGQGHRDRAAFFVIGHVAGDDVAHRRAAVFGEVVDQRHREGRHVVDRAHRRIDRRRNAVGAAVVRGQREGRQVLAAVDQRQAGGGQRDVAGTRAEERRVGGQGRRQRAAGLCKGG